MLEVLFFGSSECEACARVFVILNRYQIPYLYVDANDEDDLIQSFCDINLIDKLPHIQILDEQENILSEKIGSFKDDEFIAYFKKYFNISF